jgi:hypothetical protein
VYILLALFWFAELHSGDHIYLQFELPSGKKKHF